MSVMITHIKMRGHGQQCTIMYEVYGHFYWHITSVLIGEKSFIASYVVAQ